MKIPQFLLLFFKFDHMSHIERKRSLQTHEAGLTGVQVSLSLSTDPLPWLLFPCPLRDTSSYFCPPEGLDTLSAGRMRAADKRLQEVRPEYLLSEQSAVVAQIHTHIVRYMRDSIIAGLSNMCRAGPPTLVVSALQAMTGQFS